MPANAQHISALQIYPLGDAAVVVQFGDIITEEIYARVQALAHYLDSHPFDGMVEYVPAFTTVTIFYNPWVLSEKGKQAPYEKAVTILKNRIDALGKKPVQDSKLVTIPVCYGGKFGPDLEFVAAHNQLTTQEVIHIHSNADYLVYMIGFAPGFPYLGGMDQRIVAPRKDTPRSIIPEGSVGIAGSQTGVYPMKTPGGWQLIGRTPLPLFDPHQEHPTLLKAGDRVRFVPISMDEYQARKEQKNEY